MHLDFQIAAQLIWQVDFLIAYLIARAMTLYLLLWLFVTMTTVSCV